MTLPPSLRLLLPDGTVKRILLEDYLRGVVAAALPADAPLEAMKALAVAGRTFAATTHRHLDRGADVCTLRHCQAWNERANPRAARAVLETRGVVALYNDKLIEAFYFDHCDGKTRGAQGVLMDAPGYLKSVPCACGFASLKGHGIGMCLRGMVSMARFGESADFILRHYYTGIALQQLSTDPSAPVQEPLTPPRRTPPTTPSVTSNTERNLPRRTRPVARPAPRVETPKPAAETPAPVEPAKPARTPITPRRSSRPKIEQATPEEPLKPVAPTPEPLRTPEAKQATPPAPSPEPLVPLLDVHSPEEDDLYLLLTVEDDAPPAPKPAPSVISNAGRNPPRRSPQPDTFVPPTAFTSPPPPSMPEEDMAPTSSFIPPPSSLSSAPPFSMPEELPSAGILDFTAPPIGAMPEEPNFAGSDFLAPPANIIEPDLADFIPPIEKFYTPLDAPPTMPEEVPTFTTAHTDATPISWAAPPPLQENAQPLAQPRILMDTLPGPRIIAGNLPKAGTLITIRDARGNSVVTVSGVAKQYGGGGFEAPLTDDGAYQVKFDATELDVNLQNETVFIYYN